MSRTDDDERSETEPPEGNESVSTLDEDGTGTTARSMSYEDVDINLTAGFRPTIVVSLVVAVSFVAFGGIIPGFAGDGGGITVMTYTVVLWGAIVGVLGFVYEYWIRRNQEAAASG